MKKIIILLAFCIVTGNIAIAQTKEQEIEAIKTVCNYYLEGGTNGDSLTFSKAFAPDGQMRYMKNDTLMNVSLKDFMARTRNTGIKQNRTTKIEGVQVFGNAATPS